MTTIEQIKAEIERLKDENRKIKCQANERYCSGYDDAFYDLVPFIDSLESEKPMEDGLEEEIKRYGKEEMPVVLESDLNDIARHFAEWGKEQGYREGFLEGTKIQREEDDQLVDTIYQQGIEKGKDDMKEQAVSGTLAYEPHLRRIIVNLDDIPDGAWNGGGTPVEVIIFKKEQVTYERSTTSGI